MPFSDAYISLMIRDHERLVDFERQAKKEAVGKMSYLDALAIFESL